MFSTCLLWYKGLQVLQGNRPEVQLSLSVVSINERQHPLKKVTLAEAQSKTPLEQALKAHCWPPTSLLWWRWKTEQCFIGSNFANISSFAYRSSTSSLTPQHEPKDAVIKMKPDWTNLTLKQFRFKILSWKNCTLLLRGSTYVYVWIMSLAGKDN